MPWYIYAIAVGIGCFFVAQLIPTPKEQAKDDKDEPIYETENPWDVHEFGKNRDAGKWVNLPKCRSHTNIVGTGHRSTAARAFLRAATISDLNGQNISISLLRDPSNQYDKNAIKVIGTAKANGQAWAHIGFLDREIAAHIAYRYRAEMPISAELIEAGKKGSHTFFKINVLVPAAADRKQFELIEK